MSSASSPVPFNDLTRGTRLLRADIESAVGEVLDRGWYVFGPNHAALEGELAAYLGVASAVLVGNGTDALQLALAAVGIGPGATVLTAANAGGYTSAATRALGAVPVYADVDPGSLLLTAETIEAAVVRAGRSPDALVVTHLYGATALMGPIVAWARDRGIPVVEDCAQSLGSMLDGQRSGTFGDVATTSFYPTKNLGALGDGGAVFTSRPEIDAELRLLRQYGWDSKYHVARAGGRNSRMDEIQAAIVRRKLPLLDEWNEVRRRMHRRYAESCGPGARMVHASGPSFVAHLAVVEVADRARAQRIFAEAGVATEVHYPIPDHCQPYLDPTGQPDLPVTTSVAERILSVPLFPELTSDEVARVCDALGAL